ncbi:hypothetical protein DT076_12265 [Desertihabitans brevis]|uniref:Type IV toxin-antitoxin system AbiEi family antitoxin domain-containing protein n=1 Tax=Desertihabitans brevis TaxID=2268447 RepID=A0A367YTE1_9ACTN|nr:hypothetical protein [Desertihabitans brevis]RCK69114.1 hypothetical protein DT076_12265 [Desertihabitans brevis]
MDDVRLTRDLVRSGWSHDELRRATRGGPARRVRRGAYVLGAGGDDLPDVETRHRELVDATLRLKPSGPVISHHSAALLHEIPLYRADLTKVALTRARRSGGRIAGPVHLRTAGLPEHHLTTIGGRQVTSPARTVVDLARAGSLYQAVAAGDHALHHELATAAELAEVLEVCRTWPGIGRARRAVTEMDGRSESVGESISRLVLAALGFPAQELQLEIVDVNGEVRRVDFAWPARRVVGEFDGRVKYGRLLEPGQDPGEVVFAEKLREDAIRPMTWTVVRWIWSELFDQRSLRRRLELAFRG